MLTLDSSNFDQVKKEKTNKVILFKSEWSIISKEAETNIKFIGSNDYDIYCCDVDKNPEIAAKLKIRNIPTMLFVKGSNIIENIVGSRNAAEITNIAESIF